LMTASAHAPIAAKLLVATAAPAMAGQQADKKPYSSPATCFGCEKTKW
jgi:hypothetical protein